MTHDLTDKGMRECPFCGGDATTCEGDGKWYVACLNMGCFCALGEGYDRDAMPNHTFHTEEDAIAAWNIRSLSKPLEKENG